MKPRIDAFATSLEKEARGKPKNMAGKEWEAKQRKTRRELKMVRQEYEADWKIRDKAPTRILRRRVDKLSYMCDCTGEFKEWRIMRSL